MKKIILILFAFMLLAQPARATETSIPAISGMEYTITIKKIELYNSTTGQWITANQTPTTFNIASVDAGTVAGNLVSGASLTNGTYTQIRVTVGNSFSMKAFVSIGGQGKCTSGTATINTNTFAGVANCASIASASSVTAVIDFTSATLPSGQEVIGTDLRSTSGFTGFTIGPGSAPKTASVAFDLNNVFKHYTANHFSPGSAETITPGQPSVTQSIE